MFGIGPVEMLIVGGMWCAMLAGPIWLYCHLRSLSRQLQELKVSVQRIETREDHTRRAR